LWATQRLLPLTQDGDFARGLAAGRRAALDFQRRLREDPAGRFDLLGSGTPELDIVVWKARSDTPEKASESARRIFAACAVQNLHLALVQLPQRWFEPVHNPAPGELVTCLRSVLMKPEHEAWLERIWAIFAEASKEVLAR